MEPIVLIHGYSAESKETTKPAIADIYGTLPKALRDLFGRDAVVEIDLSRYVSLEDGVTIDDISRGLDQALRTDFPRLLKGPFHVIIHSTGALVIRNWVRRFYVRTDTFSPEAKAWLPQVPKVNGCFLEVSAVEPETQEILYLPMRFEFTAPQLDQWIRGHRTTLVDVELLRLPSPEIYRLVRY